MTQTSVEALLALQEIDRDIFRVSAELKRLPAELSQREADLERMRQELEEKRRATQELAFTLREIENITSQQRTRMRKVESEMLKSKADVALVAAYEHEIRSLKKNISQAEEEGLGMVEQSERIQKEVQELAARVAEEEKTFAELRENIQKEVVQAQQRLANLKESSKARMHDGIPPEHLSIYRGLLATREGEAMALLEGRFCQGCYVEIPKNLAVRLARGTDLVQCPSCGRILYSA